MPLPPALLAKLQKRGIVRESQLDDQRIADNKIGEEEVFAEDYDEPAPKAEANIYVNKLPSKIDDSDDTLGNEAILIHEVIACPNKSNPYHNCVDYCKLRWGMKAFEPDSNMVRLKNKMLQKYPLPDGWQEVADPQTSRYYYWNMLTDEICWLSPVHPRAMVYTHPVQKKTENSRIPAHSDERERRSYDEGDDQSSEADSDDERRPIKPRGYHQRKRDRTGRDRSDDLDPMDPSAYSKVPRGTWSSGLDDRGSAKTGVDHTVAGPLFQQRPYPSPGAVLRANRQYSDKD